MYIWVKLVFVENGTSNELIDFVLLDVYSNDFNHVLVNAPCEFTFTFEFGFSFFALFSECHPVEVLTKAQCNRSIVNEIAEPMLNGKTDTSKNENVGIISVDVVSLSLYSILTLCTLLHTHEIHFH